MHSHTEATRRAPLAKRSGFRCWNRGKIAMCSKRPGAEKDIWKSVSSNAGGEGHGHPPQELGEGKKDSRIFVREIPALKKGESFSALREKRKRGSADD